jgi:hypothetical protein
MTSPLAERALAELRLAPARAYAVSVEDIAVLCEALSRELEFHAGRAVESPALWSFHADAIAVRKHLCDALRVLLMANRYIVDADEADRRILALLETGRNA